MNGRHVEFDYCVSFVVGTVWRRSEPVFVPAGSRAWPRGLPYVLISLACGWWSVPWGLLWTPWSIAGNLFGGREVGGGMMRSWALIASALACSNLNAGIYVPGEEPSIAVGEDGVADPMGFDNFRVLLARARAGYVTDPEPSREREELLDRLAGVGDSPDHLAERTALQLRAGLFDAALNELGPAARQRPVLFPTYAHLAWAHFLQGGYREMLEPQSLTREGFPRAIDGYTPAQAAWYRALEGTYVRRLVRGRINGDEERLDPIFEEPVEFVGPDGTYLAGGIDPSQGAKLPPDAIAVVQQLVLWAPYDARLYWLLGELYNAKGNLDAAAAIFDECINARGYQNESLRERRRAVAEELERRRPVPEPWFQPGPRLWAVLGVAVLALMALVYWQAREIRRRLVRK